MTDSEKGQEVTCLSCYLSYEKTDISDGQMTRCPRCQSLVVA